MRTGFRRLHISGGCWYKAAKVERIEDLANASYHAQCGVCWKEGRALPSKTVVDKLREDSDSSVTTDDETSSSDAS